MSARRSIREAWWRFLWDWATEGNREAGDVPKRRHPLLGETEDGDILMPSKERPDWWGPRRFNGRNPTHWPAYLRSRRARSLAMVEVQR